MDPLTGAVILLGLVMLWVALGCWRTNKKDSEIIEALTDKITKFYREFEATDRLVTSNIETTSRFGLKIQKLQEAQGEICHSLRMVTGDLRIAHEFFRMNQDQALKYTPQGFQQRTNGNDPTNQETEMKKTTAKPTKKAAAKKKVTKAAKKKSKK